MLAKVRVWAVPACLNQSTSSSGLESSLLCGCSTVRYQESLDSLPKFDVKSFIQLWPVDLVQKQSAFRGEIGTSISVSFWLESAPLSVPSTLRSYVSLVIRRKYGRPTARTHPYRHFWSDRQSPLLPKQRHE